MMVDRRCRSGGVPHRGQTILGRGDTAATEARCDDVARKVRPWRDFEPIDERQRRGFTQPGATRQEILHELKRA